MSPEECGICEDLVSFSQTVHVMIHTHSDEGVIDFYVCQRCYEDGLRPLFSQPDAPEP